MSADTKNAIPIEINPKEALNIMDPLTNPSPTDDGSLNESQKSAIPLSSDKLVSVKTVGTNGVGTGGIETKNGGSEKYVVPVGPASDIQKKQRRAERFGMNVKLSEKEKLFSRAERFGTSPTLSGSVSALRNAEDGKRKARAERFGLPAKTPAAVADEEAKKKARLSRFAQVSKTDSVEVQKRESRAARFSISANSVLPQVNDKGNVDMASGVGKSSGI